MNIIQAIRDPNLFRPLFKDLDTWRAWLVVYKAAYALPMDRAELKLFRKLTGRTRPPRRPVRELVLVVGRRGGKSFAVAVNGAYTATFVDYRPYLSPGEKGVVMITSQNRQQACVIMNYLHAIFSEVAMLNKMVTYMGRENIELNNNIVIEVHAANFRAVRGYTIVASMDDEVAYWRSEESANPDVEIINAKRAGMSTIPNSMEVMLSSPYARRGLLWERHKLFYGRNTDDVLVVQADTLTMNPTVDRDFIAREYERDPLSAAAEFGAQFRSDLEAFVTQQAVDAVVPTGLHSRPYVEKYQYKAFVDPSGGSFDSFTLSIGHREGDRAVLDLLLERKPPFSPEGVTHEFALMLKSYHITTVTGDRYAGEWPREQFSKRGVSYRVADKNRSELYLNLLPAIHSQQIELLDDPVLIRQLTQLERRTARSGKDSIDHPPNAHDDMANAAAGVMALLTKKPAQLHEIDLLSEEIINEAEAQWRRLTM